MALPGRTYAALDDKYKYGFNGKESDIDGEFDAYDFGARLYDERLGRWMSSDPEEKSMPSYSTYNFCYNNPIFFADDDGDIPIVKIFRKSKSYISHMEKMNRYRVTRGLPALPINVGTITLENPTFVYSVNPDGSPNVALRTAAISAFSNPLNGANSYAPGTYTYIDDKGYDWTVIIKPINFVAVRDQVEAETRIKHSKGGSIVNVLPGLSASILNPLSPNISNAEVGGTNINFYMGNLNPRTLAPNDGWAIMHEIMHNFGFVDQYTTLPSGAQVTAPNFRPGTERLAGGNGVDIMSDIGVGFGGKQVNKIGNMFADKFRQFKKKNKTAINNDAYNKVIPNNRRRTNYKSKNSKSNTWSRKKFLRHSRRTRRG